MSKYLLFTDLKNKHLELGAHRLVFAGYGLVSAKKNPANAGFLILSIQYCYCFMTFLEKLPFSLVTFTM